MSETSAPLQTPRPRLAWRGLLVDALLLVLIGVGVYFRFSWTNWSQGTDLHPDEYGLTSTLTQLRMPATWDEWFNTRLSPISPYQKYDPFGNPTQPGPDNRMRWGQWPIILLKWGAELTGNTGYTEQRLFGRQFSALADTLALGMLFLIGRRLFGRRIGLLAAALSALAVMQIQQSHFMTSDNIAVLFTALSVYAAVRVAQEPADGRGRWLWAGLFGLFFGLTVASRINLAVLAGLILVAAASAHRRQWLAEPAAAARQILLLCLLAGAVSLAAFRLVHPMAFRAPAGDTTVLTVTPNPEWLASLAVAQSESSGIGGGPPGEQWTNRPALIFPWINMTLWGMGLPLGLLAWAALAWAAWRLARSDWAAEHAPQAAPLLIPVIWVGGYFLFMGTRWVKSVRYFLPIYPFLALLAAWALSELWARGQQAGARSRRWLLALAAVVSAGVLTGTLAWAWGFTSIYRTDNTRIQASRWIFQNVPAPLSLELTDAEGGAFLEPVPFGDNQPLTDAVAYRQELRLRRPGTLTGIAAARVRNMFDPAVAGTLEVVLSADPGGQQVLASARLPVAPDPAGGAGLPAQAPVAPVELAADQPYYLMVSAPDGGPLQLSQSVVANESWDEGLPLRVDGRDPFGGLYRGLTMEVRWPDDENKRLMFLTQLEQADYILVPSQRAVWAASRLPAAYPLTMEYYRALFDGRLGFERAAQFQSPITLGPLQISDVAGTWAWGQAPRLNPNPADPFNDNIWSAEEAFSVYDHAPVWIFRKRADFKLEQARAVLQAVSLDGVVQQGPLQATQAPTLLMLPADLLAVQRAGGTWSEMFDLQGLLNTSPALAALAWYLTLALLGGLAFPLTFIALGGLPDKGYPFARSVALLAAAWLTWMAGSLRVLAFTRGTIGLAFAVVGLLSLGVVLARRAELAAYLRSHWRHILGTEALALGLFALMLLIRAGNPDLWHPYFGGEKPMDFSYFNAVLKSTYFPPYDPWLAGGYLNYYYYGFVVAGLITKLLGVMPSLAYNLILPMLFSLVGVNAFGVAYNLVAGAAGQLPGPAAAAESDPPAPAGGPGPRSRPHPYLAGVAAALLIVVLGNLAQVRTYLAGFQKAAEGGTSVELGWNDAGLAATLNGFWRVAAGQTGMPVGLGSWYWDATRIIPAVNGGGAEITEFPFFSFLYADLHAHLIVMPFTVLALGWALACLQGFGRPRRRWESAAVWALGGLAIGVTRPSNTWDYPTYLAIGAAAVVAGQWLTERRMTRRGLLALAGRLALLAGLTVLLYRPFDQWVVVPLTELKRWDGAATPFEAYVYIHGLFLFLLVSLLAVETGRWLAETPASVLSAARQWAGTGALLAAAFLAVLGALVYLGVQVAWVAWPLMAWAGLLLLRPRLAPEKRAVFFLLGTGLAVTVFVDLFTLGGDRMNTIFKLYMQVWLIFSVAGGAALAWVWADLPAWPGRRGSAWTVALAVLAAAAGLYTVTAAAAKMRDRFVPYAVSPAGAGCEPLPGVPLPYERGLDPGAQPLGLDGLQYLSWSAYCEQGYFLPLSYDYDAIRWMQAHVAGSPVIAEGQTFDLYRLSSRYAWNTGLPDVVGWDWHQRQQRGALPTEFITRRGTEVSDFFATPDAGAAEAFLRRYAVGYVIVGPFERAHYPAEGLAKFDQMASGGRLSVAYRNPGVTIYAVAPSAGDGSAP